MPFETPNLAALLERARQAFRAHLPGTDAWLWPNNINPSAKVMAGLTHEVFGFADYIARQKFALTADGENLDRHGYEVGLSRRPAAPARGFVTFTAPAALAVEANAILARSDGVTFRVVNGGGLPGAGALSLEVVAETAGLSTITVAGTDLAITSGVSGTASVVVSDAGLVGGADVEGDESFRARILFRKRNPPQGGSAADYVIWASQIPGVTRVFVERLWSGAGTVRVFPIFDNDYAGGVAPAERIAQVADYLSGLRPAGAALTVQAPAAQPIAVTISGLVPNTPTVQEAIRAELRDAFRRLGRVSGNDTPSPSMAYLATPLSFSRSWIWQAVANATGEQAHTIAAPAADIAVASGNIPTLGTVTFS